MIRLSLVKYIVTSCTKYALRNCKKKSKYNSSWWWWNKGHRVFKINSLFGQSQKCCMGMDKGSGDERQKFGLIQLKKKVLRSPKSISFFRLIVQSQGRLVLMICWPETKTQEDRGKWPENNTSGKCRNYKKWNTYHFTRSHILNLDLNLDINKRDLSELIKLTGKQNIFGDNCSTFIKSFLSRNMLDLNVHACAFRV